MADEKSAETVTSDADKPVPENMDQPDLGASVGPGEDFDDHSTELSDEDKEAALADARVIPDPTKGMSPSEAKEYWMKKANHFESEYKVERVKRQNYDKRYGGLGGGLNGPAKGRDIDPRALTHDDLPFEVPNDIQDLKSYTRYILDEAKKQFKHSLTEEKLDERVESTEVTAREAHNGEDGWPAYDEVIDEFVVPMIKKRPDIFKVLRLMPDPAEASYTMGIMLKYPNLKEMIGSQARDDLVKGINKTAKHAATVKGGQNGRQPSGRLTKAEIDSMSVEDFEVELEKFRSGVS